MTKMIKTNRRQISYSFMIDQVPNEVAELMQTHHYRLVDQPFAGQYLLVSHPVRSLVTLKYNDRKQLSCLTFEIPDNSDVSTNKRSKENTFKLLNSDICQNYEGDINYLHINLKFDRLQDLVSTKIKKLNAAIAAI